MKTLLITSVVVNIFYWGLSSHLRGFGWPDGLINGFFISLICSMIGIAVGLIMITRSKK